MCWEHVHECMHLLCMCARKWLASEFSRSAFSTHLVMDGLAEATTVSLGARDPKADPPACKASINWLLLSALQSLVFIGNIEFIVSPVHIFVFFFIDKFLHVRAHISSVF